jgi:histidine triad (HIT) family protein
MTEWKVNIDDLLSEYGRRMDRSLDCLFCKIINRTIPASIVDESDLSLAFRDLHPTAPTHVLVIPKRHVDDAGTIEAADGPVLADMFVLAQRVAEHDGIFETGFRLVFNVGENSGNSVGHLHLHVVGGQPMGWPPFAH